MGALKEKFLALPMFAQLSVLVINLVIVFGILGPSMVSSNSTAAVWIGIILCLADAYYTWDFSEEIREKIKNA